MNTSTVLLLLLMALMASASALSAATPQLLVGPKALVEGGDCLWDEVLAWQRLRAERKVVVENDDSAPIVCTDEAERVYLATGSGKLTVSDDYGKNFSEPSDIVVDGVLVENLQAMGVLRSTSEYRVWLGKERGHIVIAWGDGGKLNIARSEDEGKTWQSAGELKANGYAKLQAGGVRITQLADNSLRLAASGRKSDGKGVPEGLVFGSVDQGKTWSLVGSLGPRCVSANVLQLPSGDLLAAVTYRGARSDGDPGDDIRRDELFNNAVVARSTDGGKTWKDHQCVTRFKEAPADLCRLYDGTIILTYGQQNFPFGGRAVISKDEGRNWENRAFILGNSTICMKWGDRPLLTYPGWQVSSVAFKSGVILTLYTRGSFVVRDQEVVKPKFEGRDFTSEIGKDKGKSIVAVRWEIGGMNKPPLGLPAGLVAIAKPNAEGYLDNGRYLVKPEHLNFGGDYFMDDEILAFQRVPAERSVVGPGDSAIAALDRDGNPVVLINDESAPPFSGAIYRSLDNGRTWELVGRSPGAASFGVLQDNTLVVTRGANHAGRNTVAVLRSSDWGKTWSEPSYVDPGPFDRMTGGGNIRIYQMPDGTVVQTCGNLYLNEMSVGQTLGSGPADMPWDGVYRSRDGGKTWGDFSFIGHPLCETNVIRLKSGRMLAAARFQGTIGTDDFIRIDRNGSDRDTHARKILAKNTAVTYSDDNGYTWKPFKSVTRFNECPGDITEMNDGTVVLSYQQKNSAPSGARAMVSRDGGMTWDDTAYMIAWYGGLGPMDVSMWACSSGGHTSSLALKDGSVLTLDNGFSKASGRLITEATVWKPLGVR